MCLSCCVHWIEFAGLPLGTHLLEVACTGLSIVSGRDLQNAEGSCRGKGLMCLSCSVFRGLTPESYSVDWAEYKSAGSQQNLEGLTSGRSQALQLWQEPGPGQVRGWGGGERSRAQLPWTSGCVWAATRARLRGGAPVFVHLCLVAVLPLHWSTHVLKHTAGMDLVLGSWPCCSVWLERQL